MLLNVEHPERGRLHTRRGHAVRIRPIVPADAALLVDLFHRMSPETRLRRFLEPLPDDLPDERLLAEATRLAAIDPRREVALVACARAGRAEQIVGVVRLACAADDPRLAEFAIVVCDDYQGEGLGTELLARLIRVARARGITCLWGLTSAENEAIQRLVAGCGLPVSSEIRHGELTLRIALDQPPL